MNSSVVSWISHQSPLQLYPNIQCRQSTTGMESSMLTNECDFLNSLDEDLIIQNYLSEYSSNNDVINAPAMDQDQATQQQIPDNYYSNFSTLTTTIHPQYHPSFEPLNFGNHKNPCEIGLPQVMEDVVPREAMSSRVEPAKKKRIRPPWQTYDHIIAERRRREQLSQLFVALSATVPGLKKMDKSSILEEAIKHVKVLQEKVKTLEAKMEKKGMESVVIVKKSQIVVNDEGSFFNYENNSFQLQSLPEIEARRCDDQILVKVHCEQQKDALANIISKIESLDMSIVSTNATPFGDVALDITIVAEMEKECDVSAKEVATALRAALNQPTA